ncbi:MAG: hypothetical protein Q9157_001241 [Trypethelium eluteriae]
MAAEGVPTRLIVCVDGTWCTPDGPHGNEHQNISNVYRLCASVKEGPVVDKQGNNFIQRKKYFNGIGSKDNISRLKRLKSGVLGEGCSELIRDVYDECCQLPGHSQDELWLYGFSRGAYIVRAVAGLLHYIRALTSAGTTNFQMDYSKALGQYKNMQKNSKLQQGRIHEILASATREAPKIQFLGAFDTVKYFSDRELYDISFNHSIRHFRHALALNEYRRAFTPEYAFPEFYHGGLSNRSFVQAWFIGAHIDMGGSAARDDLALYPLQWMLLESRHQGLALEFDRSLESRAYIDNPLEVSLSEAEGEEKLSRYWNCTTKNKLQVTMQDIRKTHTSSRYQGRYSIRVNQHNAIYYVKESRKPFSEGTLRGYCEYAPQGTIIHPSVYLILEEYPGCLLGTKEMTDRQHIENWRNMALTSSEGFWSEQGDLSLEVERIPIRVLVCGNTGVGKSTLVNKIFGEEVTTSSDRKAGLHDVNNAFTTPSRPDLIIHDSGGFEAGGDEEIQNVKRFVVEKSAAGDIKDRFCIDVNTARTQQRATRKLFEACSQSAKNIPIVVIATKKDEFIRMQKGTALEQMPNMDSIPTREFMARLQSFPEEQLQERMKLIENELLEVDTGRFDAILGVSKDDEASLRFLTTETLRCFDHEKVRLSYIAAQVNTIDLKVELAIAESMRVYKHTMRTSVASGIIPGGATTTRLTVAAVVCQKVVNCFGVPGVSVQTIQQIVKTVVWDDVKNNLAVFGAELVAFGGMAAGTTVILLPLVLVTGAINAFVVPPATGRLLLMLACDLILILVQAFKESINKCIGQPRDKDIERAAHAYYKISKKVHREVKDVVPKNMIKNFRYDKISNKFKTIVETYVEEVTKGIDMSKLRINNRDDDDSDSDSAPDVKDDDSVADYLKPAMTSTSTLVSDHNSWDTPVHKKEL